LEILHGYVEANGSQAAVIAFQDSEAFDSSLISELINLFRSVESCFWRL
jgi:origin recognition complex subunit 3